MIVMKMLMKEDDHLYIDADEDGFVTLHSRLSLVPVNRHLLNADDCDDINWINFVADEVCEEDNDCDGFNKSGCP